jgi:plasmid stabilization system protein ParE
MQLEITKRAKRNLDSIGEHYYKIGGNALARKMIARIKDPFQQLLNFPYSAPVYPYKPNLRCLIVTDGLFVVFYRIEHSAIAIIHIRRAEQDLL